MNRRDLVEELSQKNTIYPQLFDDWIDIGSYSFWRFFPTEKSLRSWDAYLRKVMLKFNSPNIQTFKSDVKGMIIVLDHCVVRTYRTNLFLRIRPLYRLRNPYLEKCLESKQLENNGVFVCKKIKPLLDVSSMTGIRLSVKMTPHLFEQLLQDVEKGISKIHSYGYCHNDVSLDNTGYDEETKKFVLFDYDAATRITIMKRKYCFDRTSFEKSLKTWEKLLPVK